MKLIDLSTPTPYAIILLATFIYFFVYAGKGNNPVDNAFSFVNTLFQQLVKATETTQEYLTEEIKRTNLEAKNAQNELKEEHRIQRERLTQHLNTCENEIIDIGHTNQYLEQMNHHKHANLERCEQMLSIEEEKNSITYNKIGQFKEIIKKEDGSFNEEKFMLLQGEIREILHEDLTNSKALQKVHQRSQERLLAMERSAPLFPSKKVVQHNRRVNKLMDGILNLFGIQTKPTEKGEVLRPSNKDNFSPSSPSSPSSTSNHRSYPTPQEEKTSEAETEGRQKNNDVTMMQYGGH